MSKIKAFSLGAVLKSVLKSIIFYTPIQISIFTIASDAQFFAHFPHPIHLSLSICAPFLSIVIAWTGQTY